MSDQKEEKEITGHERLDAAIEIMEILSQAGLRENDAIDTLELVLLLALPQFQIHFSFHTEALIPSIRTTWQTKAKAAGNIMDFLDTRKLDALKVLKLALKLALHNQPLCLSIEYFFPHKAIWELSH